MKKMLLVAVCAMFSSAAFSQMAVSGGDFANHPEKYENKQVTIKNVSVSTGDNHAGPGAHHAGPAVGGHTKPCTPPRGNEEIAVSFKENPGYQGCFYAQGPLATQIKNQTRGGQPVDCVLTIKGNSQLGYLITNFKAGH